MPVFFCFVIKYKIKENDRKTVAYTHREIYSESCSIKPNSGWIYHFPFDLEPNGIPFACLKYRERVISIQIWFNLIDLKSSSLCVWLVEVK